MPIPRTHTFPRCLTGTGPVDLGKGRQLGGRHSTDSNRTAQAGVWPAFFVAGQGSVGGREFGGCGALAGGVQAAESQQSRVLLFARRGRKAGPGKAQRLAGIGLHVVGLFVDIHDPCGTDLDQVAMP